MIDPGRWPLVSAQRMRALDAYTIEKLSVPGSLLMESAGRAVLDALLDQYGDRLAGRRAGDVMIVCGAGNNAGDGFVLARQLKLLGYGVRVALAGDRPASPDALANLTRAEAVGVAIEGADWRAPDAGILVDALFGTGLSRPVTGAFAEAIERINGSDLPVVSIDLPSGLDTDTGQVLGCAVRADLCVTISLPKRALALPPGRELAGRVRVARIGIADEMPGELRADGLDAAVLWSRSGAARELPERPRDGHKGRFGHVLVIAGSQGKTGAAALAAKGALRGGSGLVTLACPSSLNDILEQKCTEAMTAPVAETARRGLSGEALEELVELAGERDVVAMGPGVGRDKSTESLMRSLVRRLGVPLVIDADGLNAFAGNPGALRAHAGPTVLTPHPGEAAALLGRSAAEINHDRVAAARDLARETDSVVLLKGAATVVAEPAGRVIINPTGGPALSTGGTGDVLTGLVAALLAQGVDAMEAAALAAYLHGAAGDWLSDEGGESGLLASDLADALPAAARALRAAITSEEGSSGHEGRTTLLSFP